MQCPRGLRTEAPVLNACAQFREEQRKLRFDNSLPHLLAHRVDVGDPVDSTGPRMLERAIGSYSPTSVDMAVWVAPASLLYPKFDPG